MRTFHRTRGDRKLFLQSIAHNLVIRERMVTTVARAKEIRPMVERLLSVAKQGKLSSFRRLLAILPKRSSEKLFRDLGPRYRDRRGGALRIVKQGKRRKRDGAETALIEFV